jgi:hypothetical protein
MRLLLVAVLVLLTVTSCAGPITLGEGRVSGLVGASPASPLGNSVIPGVNKEVQFVSTDAGHVQSITSGPDGRYWIDLSPGKYEVRLVGYAPLQLYYGRDPKTYGRWPQLTIVIGHETTLDLIYDSRIR